MGTGIRPDLGKSHAFCLSLTDDFVPISQNELESDPHFVVLMETSAWHTMASVQLDTYIAVPWLSWGELFLLNTAERRP